MVDFFEKNIQKLYAVLLILSLTLLLVSYNQKYRDNRIFIPENNIPLNNSMLSYHAESISDISVFDQDYAKKDYFDQFTGASVSTFADLLHFNASQNTQIKTLGYYSANDGGGAIYDILPTHDKADGLFTINLDNGLQAHLEIFEDTIEVSQIGAYGDGAHDDRDLIQAALSKTGKIRLAEGKTYILKKGLIFPSDTTIIGNNATFEINEFSFFANDSNPKENGGVGVFGYQFFVPERMNTMSDNLDISDLTVNWNCKSDLNHVTTYFLIKYKMIENVLFDNISININGNRDNSVQPVTFQGTSNHISIKNSSVINNTRGYYGSCIWIQSNMVGGYPDVMIDNCYLYSSARDEIFSSLGLYQKNITVSNCELVQNLSGCISQDRSYLANADISLTNSASTYLVNYSGNLDSSFVTYDSCSFSIQSTVGNEPRWFTSVSSTYGGEVKTLFKNCFISGTFSQTFISGENTTQYHATGITDNNEFRERISVSFDECTINVNVPTFVNSRSANCSFNNCTIFNNNSLVDMLYVDTLISCGSYSFTNNEIFITSYDKKIIFKDISSQMLNKINVRNNTFHISSSSYQLYTYSSRDYSRFVFKHKENAFSDICIENNEIK